jgi:predicted Zn finger-like uncharacterized protein
MLFTRCPDCDTTFRVTDEALQKAHGQVRCGRCASVFNAYSELHDPESGALVKPPIERPAAKPDLRPRQPDSRAAAQPTGDRFESMTVASVVAEAALAADEDAETGELMPDPAALAAAPISDTKVQEVLETAETADGAPFPLDDVLRPRRASWRWSAAALLALIALGAQAVHHFRADLVSRAGVGPLVQQTYRMLGANVLPRWDVRQYEILDWVATAEPNARGKGSLRITARIFNRGPQSQPYPSVQLRLKDRWETAVGSRVFAPTEYLGADTSAAQLMTPGETARAVIEVVDPGPDAYGFELDVCIEIETNEISCGTDKVFL